MASDPNPVSPGRLPDDAPAKLAPPETKSLAEINAELAPPGQAKLEPGDVPVGERSSQFSLRELLAIVTIVSLELAALRWLYWLEPKQAAGLVGCVTVAWLIIMTLFRLPPRLANVVWWSLVILYLLVLAVTFAAGAVAHGQ